MPYIQNLISFIFLHFLHFPGHPRSFLLSLSLTHTHTSFAEGISSFSSAALSLRLLLFPFSAVNHVSICFCVPKMSSPMMSLFHYPLPHECIPILNSFNIIFRRSEERKKVYFLFCGACIGAMKGVDLTVQVDRQGMVTNFYLKIYPITESSNPLPYLVVYSHYYAIT